MIGAEVIDAGAQSLTEIAGLINASVRNAETSARSSLQHALTAGQLLGKAKLSVPHGRWNDWLLANCDVAPRTARSYMRLAVKFATLSAPERQRVANLPVREAVMAIATDPESPTNGREPPARMPRERQERERVVSAFRKTAASIREAARWFEHGADLKPVKVAALRKKLGDALAELDRLQQEGGAA